MSCGGKLIANSNSVWPHFFEITKASYCGRVIGKQYAKLFEMEGSELTFREEALNTVAQKAMERKTGARGLRSIMEQALLSTMYELPSMENVSKIIVDSDCINGESKPLMIYEGGEGETKEIAADKS